jgi:hypothetical protein
MWWGASLPGGWRARKIGARTVPVFDRHLVIYGLSTYGGRHHTRRSDRPPTRAAR